MNTEATTQANSVRPEGFERLQAWRKRQRELNQEVRWLQFMDKYRGERLWVRYGHEPHHHTSLMKESWNRMLDAINNRTFHGNRQSYI